MRRLHLHHPGARGRRCASLALATALLLPATAAAQATRTWVSGVGDDANPCSRTAPCKTWAGAITKTAAGGEIDSLDPGGFGAVTITKSITIDGGGGQVASSLVSGTNAFVVAAGAADNVTLRNLSFDGLGGSGVTAGLDAIKFLAGATVRVENSKIFGFSQNGIEDSNPATNTLFVSNTSIENIGGNAVAVAAPSTGSHASAVLENDALENANCGLAISGKTGGYTAGTAGTNCGGTAGSAGGPVRVTAVGTSMSANTVDGVFATGSNARATIGNSLITDNGTGVDPTSGASINFFCGNMLGGNTTDGTPSATVSGCSGATGPVGPAGPSGPVGPSGPIGPRGADGSAGATGATGPTGAAGPQGVPGARGPRGPAGQIELITCRVVHVRRGTRTRCVGKFVSGPVRFTVSPRALPVTLTHGGHVVATGTATLGRHGEAARLSVSRRLAAGRYGLILWRGRHRAATLIVRIG